jgi:hypothetical protein
VAGQVVHDHEIAGLKLWAEDPFDIGLEAEAVDWAVENEGRYDPVMCSSQDLI